MVGLVFVRYQMRDYLALLILILVTVLASACAPAGDPAASAQATLASAQANATMMNVQATNSARVTQTAREQATLEAQRILVQQQLEVAQRQARAAEEQHQLEVSWTAEAVALNYQQTAAVISATVQVLPAAQTVAAGTAQAVTIHAEETKQVSDESVLAARRIISSAAIAESQRQTWSANTQPLWTIGGGLLLWMLPTFLVSVVVWGILRVVRAYERNKRVVRNEDGTFVGVIEEDRHGVVRVRSQWNPAEAIDVQSAEPEAESEDDFPALDSLPTNPGLLDFASIPGPLMIPIGVTLRNPDGLWISLVDADSILIAGARRKGKTNLVKTMIQSLVVSRSARLVMFDGKSGVEFGAFRDLPRCLVVEDQAFLPTLQEVQREMQVRMEAFRECGASSVQQFNQKQGGREAMDRLIIIVDELAFALHEDGVEDALVDLIARGGAFGVHPILATQRPSVDVITPQIKANLSTRIALPVASAVDSRVILDRSGAEKLPKVPGRLLMLWDAELVEAQAWLAPEELPPSVTMRRSRRQITKPEPTLTDIEYQMATAAIENDNRFSINKVYQILRERNVILARQIVGKTAQDWEAKGWLTSEQRKDNGQSDSRHVTDVLLRLVREHDLKTEQRLVPVSRSQMPQDIST